LAISFISSRVGLQESIALRKETSNFVVLTNLHLDSRGIIRLEITSENQPS
jgi:hypothetical protein